MGWAVWICDEKTLCIGMDWVRFLYIYIYSNCILWPAKRKTTTGKEKLEEQQSTNTIPTSTVIMLSGILPPENDHTIAYAEYLEKKYQ